jgi:putative tricarboxylic transport membrane protein
MSDRLTGLVLLVATLWYGTIAWNIPKSFFSDPLGSRAFPLFVAFMLAPLALYLILRRPTESVVWPARRSWPPLLVATGLFVFYAYALPALGFFLANSLVFAGFALLFGARAWQAATSAVVASGVLYVVFGVLLDLYLPTGSVFKAWFG